MNDEELQGMLKKHCQQLEEHFGSIQIIATRHDHDSGETALIHAGTGCQFSRVGAVQAFLDVMEFLSISDTEES